MAIPQVSDIMTAVAGLLGDLPAEQFNSAVLLPYYSMAYREMFDLFRDWGLPTGRLDAYGVLPSNTTVLSPATIGITDMGEPVEIWERSTISTLTVSGATDTTPVVMTTSTPHGLSTGALVEIYNVSRPLSVNQQWRITVLSSTTFSLNGSMAGGSWTSGGTVIVGGDLSANPFVMMNPTNDLPQRPLDTQLLYWQWENGQLYFTGATGNVELKIIHAASGNPPQAGTVGVDNCANFLQFRTAALAAAAYDMPAMANAYRAEALGPSGQADGSGGALRALAYPLLKEKQHRPARAMQFRHRRNWHGRAPF